MANAPQGMTDDQVEAIVRSANKWTAVTAVTLSEKNACRAGAAWQREEDARIVEEHGVRVYGAHDIAAAIRRAGEQT